MLKLLFLTALNACFVELLMSRLKLFQRVELYLKSMQEVLRLCYLIMRLCPKAVACLICSFYGEKFLTLRFKEYIGNDKPKSGSMSIAKGESEWSVLEKYCRKFLDTYPRVNEDGVIDISENEGETTVLTNEGEHKIISLSRVRKRCELISNIVSEPLRGNGYEMIINNENAERLGVDSVRYLNAVDNGGVGIASCYQNIKESNELYDTLNLTVSGRVLVNIGDWIVLPDYKLGNLRVNKLRYEADGDNELTILNLLCN